MQRFRTFNAVRCDSCRTADATEQYAITERECMADVSADGCCEKSAAIRREMQRWRRRLETHRHR